MPTSTNFDDSLVFVAPAGGATAGTLIIYTAANNLAVLPLQTVVSGLDFAGKVTGAVKGVTATTAAWITGLALTITTAGVAAATTAGAFSNARAAGPKTAAATSGDVVLAWPAQPF